MRRSVKAGQRGMSLIEVLVAMLVVSLGVLALSGMLAAAARFSKTSEFRSVATLLAQDIADRMRANKPAVGLSEYELLNGYDTPHEEPGADPTCADVTKCSTQELAAIDMAQWSRAIYFSLPEGQGYIAADGAKNPPVAADVWLAWLDPEASKEEATAGDDVNHQECPPPFRNQNPQPRCLYFRVSL
jgi:type IV pilus assembly protein PilV